MEQAGGFADFSGDLLSDLKMIKNDGELNAVAKTALLLTYSEQYNGCGERLDLHPNEPSFK